MKIAIFTGPRRISAEDEILVRDVVSAILSRGFKIYVGDSEGVDAIARDVARAESNRCLISLSEVFFPRPDLGRSPAGLAERSTRMVKEALRDAVVKSAYGINLSDHVICIGFPNKPCPCGIVPARSWRSGETEGSGTWSTLALAVGHGIETWLLPLTENLFGVTGLERSKWGNWGLRPFSETHEEIWGWKFEPVPTLFFKFIPATRARCALRRIH